MDELGVIISAEKIALVTTMLHHQLKDVCSRTLDPSLARTEFRDSSSSRLTVTKLIELLPLVCTVYTRIFDSLKRLLFDTAYDQNSYNQKAKSFWFSVWSEVAVDLLVCMQLLLLALSRSKIEDEGLEAADVAKRIDSVKLVVFKSVSSAILTDIETNSGDITCFSDQTGQESSGQRGVGRAIGVSASTGATESSSTVTSAGRVKPSDIVTLQEDITVEGSMTGKRGTFMKLSLQVIYLSIPVKHNIGANVLWNSEFSKSDNTINFFCSLLKELLEKSISLVEQECDYSRWQSLPDPVENGESKFLLSNASAQTRKYYRTETVSSPSFWNSVHTIFDVLNRLIDASLISTSSPVLWHLISDINKCNVFGKFQKSLASQNSKSKAISVLLSFSACSGEESQLCLLWERCVRFIASVVTALPENEDESYLSPIAGRPDPSSHSLTIKQLLFMFVDTYRELLLIPFADGLHQVSLGQLRLVKSVAGLFNAFDTKMPVWKSLSKQIYAAVKQKILCCFRFITCILGDGNKLSTASGNIKKYMLPLTEHKKIEVDKRNNNLRL